MAASLCLCHRCYTGKEEWVNGSIYPPGQLLPGFSLRDAIRSELEHTDRLTFFGPVSFNAFRRNMGRPPVTVQLRNGTMEPVLPYDQATMQVRAAAAAGQAGGRRFICCWSCTGGGERRGILLMPLAKQARLAVLRWRHICGYGGQAQAAGAPWALRASGSASGQGCPAPHACMHAVVRACTGRHAHPAAGEARPAAALMGVSEHGPGGRAQRGGLRHHLWRPRGCGLRGVQGELAACVCAAAPCYETPRRYVTAVPTRPAS